MKKNNVAPIIHILSLMSTKIDIEKYLTFVSMSINIYSTMETNGSKIIFERERLGWTQIDLAQKSNLHRQTIIKAEQSRPLNFYTIEKIAEALQALDQAGITVRMAEIQKEAIIEFSKAMADALRQNTKIFLPTGNGTNFLESLLPGIAVMQETGLDLGSIFNGNKRKKKE